MKKTRFVFVVSVIAIFIISCKKKKDSDSNFECPETPPAFSTQVSSIISSKCATSGCHASGSNSGPGALVTYTQIKNASASIRSSVISGKMPKNSSLTTEQKSNIVCWIDAGAPNN